MFDFLEDVFSEITKNPVALFNPTTYLAFGTGLKGAEEAIGELTGRNQMRGALAEQRDALRESNRLQQKMYEDEQNRRFAEDRAASVAAGSAQRRGMGDTMGVGRQFNAADLYIGGL